MIKITHFKASFLVVSFCYFTSFVNAQADSDSLKVIWENSRQPDSLRFGAILDYYKHHTFSWPDSALVVSNYHYKLAKQKESLKEMANSFNEKGIAYYVKYDLEKSTEMFEQARSLWEQLDDSIGFARTTANIAINDYEQYDYKKALEGYLDALRIYRENRYMKGEGEILNNIGLVFYQIQDFDWALEYLCDTLDIFELIGKEDQGDVLLNIGVVYFELGEYQEAISYAEKARESASIANNRLSEGHGYFLLAKANLELMNIEDAIQFIEKSLNIYQELNNNTYINEVLTLKAEIIFDIDNSEATQLGERVLRNIDDNPDLELRKNLFHLLHKCYKSQNRFELSLEMHEKYVAYRDSLFEKKRDLAIVRQTIYDNYINRIREDRLFAENEQERLTSNYRKRIVPIIISCLEVLALLFLYLRFTTRRSRKKRAALLKELEVLKTGDNSISETSLTGDMFQLDRENIETAISRKLNETDWNVLNILLDDPVISNKELAERSFLSLDGVGSSLRRMYEYFQIKESKYKKIALLLKAINMSSNSPQ